MPAKKLSFIGQFCYDSPVPVPTDRSLAGLRELYDKINSTIARFSFIRAVVFAIGAFTLASALNAISSSEANQIIEKLKEMFEITQSPPDFNDTFLTAIYARSFSKDSAVAKESTAEGTQPAETVSPEASAKREITEEEKEKAKATQETLVDQLRKIANDAFLFTFKAPLLGTDIKVDLRIWGFLLLPLVILAEVYLCILRFKRKTIHTLASLIVKRDASNATVADQLQFSQRNKSIFLRHPAQYEIAISLIGAAMLAIYVAQAGATFWQSWSTDSKAFLINAYAFVGIYGVAYVAYARRQLNKPVLIARGLNPPIGRFLKISRAVVASVRSVARRIWARLSLGIGGLMIVSTLWLLVGAPSCEKPRTGIDYLKKPDGWLSGPLGQAYLDPHNQIIRVFYLLGLLLAVLSCLLLLCSIFNSSVLQPGRWTFILGDFGVALCLFFVTDLCFGNVLDFINPSSVWKNFELGDFSVTLIAVLLATGLWILPTWAWLRYRHRQYQNRSLAWPSKRRWLLRWYYPQIIFAAVCTCTGLWSQSVPLIGVPVFVLGIAIVAASYSIITKREARAPG